MADTSLERPWWLDAGCAETAEECGFCLGTYAVEAEVRCVDCDRPMCPLCVVVVRETASFRCADCAAAPLGEG